MTEKTYNNMIRRENREAIAILFIDVAQRSMNVFAPGMIEAIAEAATDAATDDAVTGIVITSGKDNGFMAGADLNMVEAWADPARTAASLLAEVSKLGDTFRSIETCGKPVVAAVNGLALGGGLELALGCHYRVVTQGAKYGLPEVGLGLLPGAGGTQRVMRLVGLQAALPILMQGKPMSGEKAVEIGLAHEAVPQEQVLDTALRALAEGRVTAQAAWDDKGFQIPGGNAYAPQNAVALTAASTLSHVATKGNTTAALAILRCLHDGSMLPFDQAQKMEQKYFVQLLRSPAALNIVRTMFITKQAADRLKRRPAAPAKSAMRRIGVLGTGIMGAGIAEVTAAAGIDVVMVDRSEDIAKASRARIAAGLDKQIARGRMSAVKRDKILSHLHVGADVTAFKGCEMVIEAILENTEVKHQAIREVEAVLEEGAIFATNTSALPIDELAKASARPQNFIGLHYFSPVPKMALVEVISGSATSEACLARAMDYLAQTRKTPVIVNDGYGFFTTRCVDAYLREGMHLLMDGCDPAVIEKAGEALGMPVGPLCLGDEVGNDTVHHISHFFETRESGEIGADRARSHLVLDQLDQDGRAGRKAGQGIYQYGADGSKRIDRDYLAQFAKADAPITLDAARERLLYAQLVEAARCWDDGVIEDAAEADLAACLGWAFPAYLGGPMAAIEQIGSAEFAARCADLARSAGARFTLPAAFANARGDVRYYGRAA
ncbi:3-hydroxyacyl-CoA dehydrogenase NAD-binding domain-containing protein [Litorivita sp. NS0012-18]|uniref:3-hydroxyacyl-CoA dehydrogenase NAD-binding domain-containing protein n=1 Tax=Litorivita sp. NS0012-18 TaxID=3127655 RepID=UPI003105AAAF